MPSDDTNAAGSSSSSSSVEVSDSGVLLDLASVEGYEQLVVSTPRHLTDGTACAIGSSASGFLNKHDDDDDDDGDDDDDDGDIPFYLP